MRCHKYTPNTPNTPNTHTHTDTLSRIWITPYDDDAFFKPSSNCASLVIKFHNLLTSHTETFVHMWFFVRSSYPLRLPSWHLSTVQTILQWYLFIIIIYLFFFSFLMFYILNYFSNVDFARGHSSGKLQYYSCSHIVSLSIRVLSRMTFNLLLFLWC